MSPVTAAVILFAIAQAPDLARVTADRRDKRAAQVKMQAKGGKP